MYSPDELQERVSLGLTPMDVVSVPNAGKIVGWYEGPGGKVMLGNYERETALVRCHYTKALLRVKLDTPLMNIFKNVQIGQGVYITFQGKPTPEKNYNQYNSEFMSTHLYVDGSPYEPGVDPLTGEVLQSDALPPPPPTKSTTPAVGGYQSANLKQVTPSPPAQPKTNPAPATPDNPITDAQRAELDALLNNPIWQKAGQQKILDATRAAVGKITNFEKAQGFIPRIREQISKFQAQFAAAEEPPLDDDLPF